MLKSQPVCASNTQDACAMSGAGGLPLTMYLRCPGTAGRAASARVQLRVAQGGWPQGSQGTSSLVNDTGQDSRASPAVR